MVAVVRRMFFEPTFGRRTTIQNLQSFAIRIFANHFTSQDQTEYCRLGNREHDQPPKVRVKFK